MTLNAICNYRRNHAVGIKFRPHPALSPWERGNRRQFVGESEIVGTFEPCCCN